MEIAYTELLGLTFAERCNTCTARPKGCPPTLESELPPSNYNAHRDRHGPKQKYSYAVPKRSSQGSNTTTGCRQKRRSLAASPRSHGSYRSAFGEQISASPLAGKYKCIQWQTAAEHRSKFPVPIRAQQAGPDLKSGLEYIRRLPLLLETRHPCTSLGE